MSKQADNETLLILNKYMLGEESQSTWDIICATVKDIILKDAALVSATLK